MSNLQKFKRFDLIDKFNDTSRYLDDIFTVDNHAFAEHIPPWGPGGLSRECVLRIPMRVVKGD